MSRPEPEGGKAQRVDTDYVYGCRHCGRLLDAYHKPSCPTYGKDRHAKEEGRRVQLGEDTIQWRAAVDPRPRRSR